MQSHQDADHRTGSVMPAHQSLVLSSAVFKPLKLRHPNAGNFLRQGFNICSASVRDACGTHQAGTLMLPPSQKHFDLLIIPYHVD